jgi:hypothetical protein
VNHLHAIALSLPLVAACAARPPAPESPESCGIVIRLDELLAVNNRTVKVDEVYFARLPDDGAAGELLCDDIYQTNFIRGEYHYLLNIPPGRYAAIGSYRLVESPTTTFGFGVGGGSGGSGGAVYVGKTYSSRDDFTTLYAEALVRETEVVVDAGTIAFMGDYNVLAEPGMRAADAVQTHYFFQLHPGENHATMSLPPFDELALRGSGSNLALTEEILEAARAEVARHCDGTGWAEILTRSAP